MVAIGICWNGVSRAYIVPEASKVNAEFFIDFIMRPMVQEDILRLYGERAKDIVVHMDSALAHNSPENNNNSPRYLFWYSIAGLLLTRG